MLLKPEFGGGYKEFTVRDMHCFQRVSIVGYFNALAHPTSEDIIFSLWGYSNLHSIVDPYYSRCPLFMWSSVHLTTYWILEQKTLVWWCGRRPKEHGSIPTGIPTGAGSRWTATQVEEYYGGGHGPQWAVAPQDGMYVFPSFRLCFLSF